MCSASFHWMQFWPKFWNPALHSSFQICTVSLPKFGTNFPYFIKFQNIVPYDNRRIIWIFFLNFDLIEELCSKREIFTVYTLPSVSGLAMPLFNYFTLFCRVTYKHILQSKVIYQIIQFSFSKVFLSLPLSISHSHYHSLSLFLSILLSLKFSNTYIFKKNVSN